MADQRERSSTTRRASVALLIITCLVLFLGAEAVVRVLFHPNVVGSAIRYDPLLGWSLKPGARVQTDLTERGTRVHIDINSLGLRDREVPLAHPGSHRRILILGDSIAFGNGLEAGERFSDLLGRELGGNVEVINAGVPGWGNDQELLFYEKRLRRLHPDDLVLCFTANNDVVNNALGGALLEGATKPRFELGADSLRMIPPAPATQPTLSMRVKGVLRHSRLLVFVKRRLMRVTYRHRVHQETTRQVSGFEAYRDLSHWSAYENPGSDAVQNAWRVTEAILDRFAADCRADSTRLIVFAVPLKLEVDDAWRSELFHGTDADSTRIDMAYPYRRLSTYCAAHGIEFHYPIEQFRADAAHERIYFDRDSHPNARGNALAAEYLRGVLHS